MGLVSYKTLERIFIDKPIDRLEYIVNICHNKTVLDLGCYDETSTIKIGTEYWLHGRISNVAKVVVGLDSSVSIPKNGLRTGENSTIYKGNVVQLPDGILGRYNFDVIVAGELIEHLENPLGFLLMIKNKFPKKKLVLTTPNGVSLANALMGVVGREAQHKDHLANFSYKILNTLCIRAGFKAWEIKPYRFYATEMLSSSTGLTRLTVLVVEKFVRFLEWWFPLLSFGYVVDVDI